jgi:hypothetical protein
VADYDRAIADFNAAIRLDKPICSFVYMSQMPKGT